MTLLKWSLLRALRCDASPADVWTVVALVLGLGALRLAYVTIEMLEELVRWMVR